MLADGDKRRSVDLNWKLRFGTAGRTARLGAMPHWNLDFWVLIVKSLQFRDRDHANGLGNRNSTAAEAALLTAPWTAGSESNRNA